MRDAVKILVAICLIEEAQMLKDGLHKAQYSGDLKSNHSKSGLFEDLMSNDPEVKRIRL